MDCSTAVSFYSLNEQIAAERAANSPTGGTGAADGSYKGQAASAAGGGKSGSAVVPSQKSIGGYSR